MPMKKGIYLTNDEITEYSSISGIDNSYDDFMLWIVHVTTKRVETLFIEENQSITNAVLIKEYFVEEDHVSDLEILGLNTVWSYSVDCERICAIPIEDLNEYIKILDIINEHGKVIFRGQKNEEWGLLASIFRKGYHQDTEYNILKDIKKYNHQEFFNERFIDSVIHMQHYGIHTRLLDWTNNPLIALFFSCEDNSVDGRIFSYQPSEILQFDSNNYENLSKYLEEDFNGKSLSKNTISFLLELCRRGRLLFIESPYENDRIRAQRGLFSIYVDIKEKYLSALQKEIIEQCYEKFAKNLKTYFTPNLFSETVKKSDMFKLEDELKKPLGDETNSFDEEIENIKKHLKDTNYYNLSKNTYKLDTNANDVQFIIKKEKKEKIKKQLEKIGINEVSVYPDINGFINYINEKYGRNS